MQAPSPAPVLRHRLSQIVQAVPTGGVLEDCFETSKNEFGLDHNETRSRYGWQRHVSLAMLAFAIMAAIRHRANQAPLPKRMRTPRRRL